METQQESEPVHPSVCMIHRKMVNVHFPHTTSPLDPMHVAQYCKAIIFELKINAFKKT